MNQPNLDVLMKNVDSKYSLVVVTAKRAREITDAHTDKELMIKPVTQALYEVAANKVKYKSFSSGIK